MARASKAPAASPRQVTPDDIDPHHRWDRPLQAPGHTQVDFEERVDFRRLHDYRLARTRQALARSGLGALLCFDQHNIRYITSTVIGEWARDKLTRYSLLTGNGDPYVWDFGSAARHHRLHAPWLITTIAAPACSACAARWRRRRGSSATPRARSSDSSCGRAWRGCRSASTSSSRPCCSSCRRLGIEVRDGQQTMLEARDVKSTDELTLLNMAAAMVDGVYQDIAEALKPGVRESEIVALATTRLYEMGSDCVEAINAISGERCSPHPHNFTDRLIRPGRPGVLRHHPVVHGLPHVLLPDVQRRPGDRAAADGLQEGTRVDGQRDRADQAGRGHGPHRAIASPGAGDRLRERDGGVRPQLLPRSRAWVCTSGR